MLCTFLDNDDMHAFSIIILLLLQFTLYLAIGEIMRLVLLGSATGILFLVLIVITIVSVTVCNRMHKVNRNLTRYII